MFHKTNYNINLLVLFNDNQSQILNRIKLRSFYYFKIKVRKFKVITNTLRIRLVCKWI